MIFQRKKSSDKEKYTDDDESDEVSDSSGSSPVVRRARNKERRTNTFNIPQVVKTKVPLAEEVVCEHFSLHSLQ